MLCCFSYRHAWDCRTYSSAQYQYTSRWPLPIPRSTCFNLLDRWSNTSVPYHHSEVVVPTVYYFISRVIYGEYDLVTATSRVHPRREKGNEHAQRGIAVGGHAEEAGDAVYSNGTRTMKERKRLILSCLLAYRRARLRYFIIIRSINIHQYDSSYFPVHHIPSSLAIGRTYVHRTSHWSNTSDNCMIILVPCPTYPCSEWISWPREASLAIIWKTCKTKKNAKPEVFNQKNGQK